jgi:RHS repeat-associated protein
MHLYGKKIIHLIMVLVLQWGFSFSSLAQYPTFTIPLKGSLDKVRPDTISTVADPNYFVLKALNQLTLIEQTYVIKNMVSVGIEEESKYAIQTDFTATVILHIKKYNQNETVFEEFDKTFVVDYKKDAGTKNNAIQYFPFENAYKVEVKVVSVTPNSGVSWNVSRVLRIDNTLSPIRDYVFTCNKVIDSLKVTPDIINNELYASWNDPNSGQTEYDLEWAWIDESAIDEYKAGSSFLQDKIFANNATRVTISNSYYNIPLLYDGDGRIFVRVRPAQIKYNGQRIEGAWAWKLTNTATDPVYSVYNGHENALNWQASTSYAEEGKRKTVIQYFDGTLRNRQTVTKDNTTNTTLVAETFYDYQGRPVIQILPAPTLNNIIKYSQNFNQAINYTGYPKWAYDALGNNSNCGSPATALSTVSGTAKYYSPANDNVNTPSTGYNENGYIPNSVGIVPGQAYPFTETRFTPDGRVAAQGGVGETHQIGSNHETKYLYEPPAQEELDALFGTEAGVASHYFKNLVKDANGQYSVSYTDMHGRTVATALAGKYPDQLDSLLSSNRKAFSKQLIDDETNRVLGKSIISTKSLVVPMQGDYKFTYELNPEQLKLLNCDGQQICYDCLYNLTITITSDCANQAEFPYTVVDSNFTIAQSLASPLCNANGKTTGFFSKIFTKNLPEGAYTVTKKLSLSDSALSIYREVFMKYDTCKTIQDFYDKEYQSMLSKSNCTITCESCKASIGNDFTEFQNKYISEMKIIEPLTADIISQLQAAYNDAMANCTNICNTQNGVDDGMDAIRSIRQTMLLDVTPPYGQYAKLEDLSTKFNVLNTANNYHYALSAASTVSPYKNEYGIAENDNPAKLSQEDFSAQFKSSWAEELLYYHPEYPKLKITLDNLPAAYQFEANLNKTTTWQTAGVAGYINNLINVDPFFNGTVVNGNTGTYRTEMIAKMNAYATATSSTVGCTNTTIQPSMWQLAQSAVFCKNIVVNPPCSSEVENCRIQQLSTPPLNPTMGCATDWDLIWQTYRSLYLTERRKIISKYITAYGLPNNDAVITNVANKLKLRFVDFSNSNTYTYSEAGDLKDFFDQLSAGNNTADATAHSLANEQYSSTCRAYSDMWLAQLEQCPSIAQRWTNPSLKSADSIWLTDRLVRICTYGSDEYHYLGSASINPARQAEFIAAGGSATQKEFPEVITQFLANIGLAVSELCHPFLISSPKPYDKQAPVTNELVMTKPTVCECTQLTNLRTEYQQQGLGFTTFSAYLKNRYGTDITQGALDTLTALCNGSYQCIYLPAPIALPAVLQCSGLTPKAVKTCIDCDTFQIIRTAFNSLYHKQAPINDPVTDADFAVNNAFEKFANYKTGFSKNITEYISFFNTCGNYSPLSCDSLQLILSNFSKTSKPGRVVHALQTQEGQVYNTLSQIIDNGTIHFPDSIRAKTDTWYNNYGFNLASSGFCTNAGYSVEVSLKFFVNNKTGDVFYTSLGADFTVQRNTSGIYTGLSAVINGVRYVFDPNPAAILNWMIFRVKVLPNRCYVYYNNTLIVDYARDPAVSIGNRTGFGMGIFGRQGCIDRVKVWDSQDNLKYFEDFNSAVNPTFVDPVFICPAPLDCNTAFKNYFNLQRGTSYTYAQIDSVYFTKCGLHPAPCDTAVAAVCTAPAGVTTDSLKNVYSRFKSIYPNFERIYYGTSIDLKDIKAFKWNQKGVTHGDASGSDTTFWRLNEGGWFHSASFNMADFKTGGVLKVPDSNNTIWNPNFNLVKPLCVNNGFTMEMRVKAKIDTARYAAYPYTKGIYDMLIFEVLFDSAYYYIRSAQIDSTASLGLFSGASTGYGSVNDKNISSSYRDWRIVKMEVKNGMFKFIVDDTIKFQHPYTMPVTSTSFADVTCRGHDLQLDWFKLYDNDNTVLYDEEFNSSGNRPAISKECLPPCDTLFMQYFNQQLNASYSIEQIKCIYKSQCNIKASPCEDTVQTKGPLLCGLNEPLFKPQPYEYNPCKELPQIALTTAEEKWQLYQDSLHNVFDTAYYNKCMAAKNFESFKVEYAVSEYHYTLYYYDQAGNLVKTVQPAGIDDRHGDAAFLQNVKTARLNVKNGALETAAGNTVIPAHTLFTEYRYNTLNQVVQQKTPDAGLSKFWYDLLGRLVVSQNSKQKTANKFSYTLYDILGRITEVGQKPQTADPISRDPAGLNSWLAIGGLNKEQVTRTSYDLSYNDGSNILTNPPSILVQRNLRNRVSYTMVFDTEPSPPATLGTHTAATYYTYDIHGNVDTLLQDLRIAMLASPGNRYKKLVYNYDLISGKVNKVAYQPGLQDEFYHRYMYDAENRITEVYTSQDNLIWEKDARYSYYKHGPLARTILGQQQVQGIDYAYTLQGWLKGVNSTGVQKSNAITGSGEDCGGNSAVENLAVNARLQPYQQQYIARNGITFNPGFESAVSDNFTASIDNTLAGCSTDGTAGTVYTAPVGNLFDIGKDGVPANGNASQVANDAYGFSLNYFTGDYKPINSPVSNPFGTSAVPLFSINAPGTDLFNGNISSMAVNIPKVGTAQMYAYRYDQLNRIVAMNAYTGLNETSNGWSLAGTENYKERISYDANGNILTYNRNGNLATAMDVLTYQYPKYANTQANIDARLAGKMINNRLRYVLDEATSTYADDIKSNAPLTITTRLNVKDEMAEEQGSDNYAYDEIGNLIKDTKEGITNITWNVYGKIQSINKGGNIIAYTYDASGNRISKTAAGKTTIYVRDASGNVMSVYTADPAINSGNLMQKELHLYGSSRLGIFEINRNVQTLGVANYLNIMNTFTRGNKFFELSNHLGNVLVTVSDKKLGHTTDGTTVDYYSADVITANDYYPGGMDMPGRQYSSTNGYRYGFNGKEKDNKDGVVQYDYGFRIYDPRLMRFKSVDPLTYSYPYYTPYQFAGNMPIAAIDLDGLEQYVVTYYKDQHGTTTKIEVRAYFLNNGSIQDQNVHKMKYQTDATSGEESAVPDGGRIAKGNVLVFEVRNEGTLKESISIVDKRNKPNSALTTEELDIYNNDKKQEGEQGNIQQLAYPNTGLDAFYQSKDLENSKTKTYRATRALDQVPPLLKADFNSNSLSLKDEKGVAKQLAATAKFLKANTKKSLLITGYSGVSPGTNPNGTTTTIDGKSVPDAQAQNDRAKVIKGILLKLGVKESQLQTTNGGNINIPTGGSVPVGLKIIN